MSGLVYKEDLSVERQATREMINTAYGKVSDDMCKLQKHIDNRFDSLLEQIGSLQQVVSNIMKMQINSSKDIYKLKSDMLNIKERLNVLENRVNL